MLILTIFSVPHARCKTAQVAYASGFSQINSSCVWSYTTERTRPEDEISAELRDVALLSHESGVLQWTCLKIKCTG